jgi:hypothetical protein
MTTEKIEAFWQDATADDVARVMAGETVEARFRDDDGGNWLESDHSLGGYDSTEEFCKWISSTGCPWRFCQVYREPSWYADKPDPGPGWRLLEKFPDEDPKSEDDWFNPESKIWSPSVRACRGERQDEDIWYRRRIEPVEPEPRPILTDWQCREGDTYRHPNGLRLAITAKGFEVTQ